jgi:hypothetical protein
MIDTPAVSLRRQPNSARERSSPSAGENHRRLTVENPARPTRQRTLIMGP